ncbi:dipeptidase [Aneurinibacillus sp. Ricciae_BoGa-3]|uniref:dipeptidase n=1 Tax=Aneurinibacillus sp. Ricciae_BoGa-3 TaxID=3022697 RepID=UPI002340178E|nr:dipeptidase [Aneurinibacillus sp. Ricciae_BoGa-3]WCK52613.1 dipeptidase [Aneurinibacillus sp. Ricciae_BoGa-3]
MAHVIDGHFDLLMDVTIQRDRGKKKVIETDYLPNFKEGGIDSIVSAIFVDDSFLPEMGLRKALQQISALHAEADESSEKIKVCKNIEDLNKAKKEDKIGFVLSLEGAEPLYNDLSLLRSFYELGVRLIGLVWSRRNWVGDGSHFSAVREGRKGGITDFGVQLIEEAEKLGMVIDVSHINDEGFTDVMEFAKNPVIASHSNCRTLANTMRNLTDDQIKAIASTGGMIGMNAVNFFVSEHDKDSDIEHLIDHMDHISKLVGVQHVGLGFDFMDPFMKYVSPESSLATMQRKPFDVIKGHTSVPEITHSLMKRGYKDGDIELILGQNFMRVLREVWK